MITPTSRRSLVVTLVALGALAQGCGGNGDDALVTLDTLDAGEECPAGGVRVTTGDDADGDGKLAGDEIGSTQVLCAGDAGASGLGTAVRATELEPGDDTCPNGGVLFEAGLDDGADGGTAGDGVLQDGEVDASQALCSSEDAAPASDFDPPAGPAGTATLTARGGTSTAACGGAGGRAYLGYWEGYGSPRPVRLHTTGTVDASFAAPTDPPVLGQTPADVTVDTTVVILEDNGCDGTPDNPASLTTGDLFLESCEGTPQTALWRWTGSEGEQITGLHVAAGATLTFPTTSQLATRVAVTRDVHLEGSVTVAPRSGSQRSLALSGQRLVTTSGSKIDVSGSNGLFEARFAHIRTAGDIDARQTAEGSGSTVDLQGEYGLWNTGDIDTSGQTGTGGNAGWIYLRASSGVAASSGTLTAVGGTPTGDIDGGRAGFVQVAAGYGNVYLSGSITARGGGASCSECTAGGPPDDTDESVRVVASGGAIHSSASIDARGGAATARAEAGRGGGIMFVTDDFEGVPAGDLFVTGNLDASGGDAVTGEAGDAGDVFATVVSDYGRGQVALFGYAGVDLSGGDGGDCAGGDGGEAWLTASCAPTPLANGGVALSTPITSTGGSSLATDGAAGGTGGDIDLWTCSSSEPGSARGGARVVVQGDLTLSGGESVDFFGGGGGEIYFYGLDGVEVTSAIDASGGDGGEGGDAGSMYATSTGDVVLAGSLDFSGGDGSSTDVAWGGTGGRMGVEAGHTEFSGTCDVSGGDSAEDGGDGGTCELFSRLDPTDATGTANTAGGTGTSPGAPGKFTVDGVAQ